MSVNAKMTAIADAIRDKTGGSEALTLDDMASGVNEVYEAGKLAEQREFWEKFQQGGKRTEYRHAFQSNTFTDDFYNPIYPITIGSSDANVFYKTELTDTKVKVFYPNRSSTSIYGIQAPANCFSESKLVTIRELEISEAINCSGGFAHMAYLENIKIGGTIGRAFAIAESPLTAESLKSIITHLKDYSGTDREYTYTVTFKTSAFEALEAEGSTSPNGNTWAEYIDDLKWNLTLS